MSSGLGPHRGSAGERGSVLVLVALWLPVMVLIAAFVIDVGNAYVHRRHLQMQVDSTAFAGGDAFQSCFGGSGNQGVFDAATLFNGATATQNYFPGYTPSVVPRPNNQQIGGGADRVHLRYNSGYWYDAALANGVQDPDYNGLDGTPLPQSSVSGGPCVSPYVFDVKATEVDLPLFFGGFWGLITNFSTINTQARVSLHAVGIGRGSLPLAVPDVDPADVAVTLVDRATGAALAGCTNGCVFHLSGPTPDPSTGLNMWTGSASVPLPSSPSNVSVRVGVGNAVGTCAGTNGVTGSYGCYELGSGSPSNLGVLQVRGYDSTTVGTMASPHLRGVAPATACSGQPFFSDQQTGTATSCSANVTAYVDFGTTDPAALQTGNAQVRAIVNPSSGGGGSSTQTFPLSHTTGNQWVTSGSPFTLPVDDGPYDVTIEWHSGAGSKWNVFTGEPAVQQLLYSGFQDTTGPIKVAALSSGATNNGAPYSYPAGSTQTIQITIGIQGSLNVTTPSPLSLLRLTGGSRTSAVDCDGGGAAGFNNAIVGGCTTPYQINTAKPPTCSPDPTPAGQPEMCVPTENGTMTGPTAQGLDSRYASCPTNNWTKYASGTPYDPTDPRIVQLMVTDFSAIAGSGKTLVPITHFATFYITGWADSGNKTGDAVNWCPNNDPWPSNGTPGFPPSTSKKPGWNQGDIWGHFIKYVNTIDSGNPDVTCAGTGPDPCAPVLTK